MITTLTLNEARLKTEKIKSNLLEARQLLLEMYEGEGWRILGYSSWREYGQIEFGFSESRIYQLIDAAKTERNISTMVEIRPNTPERHLRPLVSLEPEQQALVYQTAVETAPNGKVTAAYVEQIAATFRPGSGREILHSSQSKEWYTPAPYIQAVHDVLGCIDLDPASCELANQTVKANEYFTEEMDGLSREWFGRVFLNPPYGKDGGKSNQGIWSNHLIEQYQIGNVEEAILLVNATPGNKWFAPLWDYPICFVDHRIEFYKENDEAGNATHSNCFVYLGSDIDLFNSVFSQFGVVAVKYK